MIFQQIYTINLVTIRAIKILVDSASDISKQQAKEMGVELIPLIVSFGDEQYSDGENLLPTEFYEKLTSNKNHPKTSQITPYRFEEKFTQMTENGDEVICICISSKLSGTYSAAKLSAEKFIDKVFVIDSLSATVGERLLCLYALRLIDKGLSAKEIAEELDAVKNKVVVMGVLETLEYLKKGGRISATVAFVGKTLNIKPVVALIDGEVKMIGKAIGKKRGCALMNSVAEQKGGINFDMPYCVLWSGMDEALGKNYASASEKLFLDKKEQVPLHALGSTIGTHVGPNVVGVAFFKKT